MDISFDFGYFGFLFWVVIELIGFFVGELVCDFEGFVVVVFGFFFVIWEGG